MFLKPSKCTFHTSDAVAEAVLVLIQVRKFVAIINHSSLTRPASGTGRKELAGKLAFGVQ